jgi:hypothetical protein
LDHLGAGRFQFAAQGVVLRLRFGKSRRMMKS